MAPKPKLHFDRHYPPGVFPYDEIVKKKDLMDNHPDGLGKHIHVYQGQVIPPIDEIFDLMSNVGFIILVLVSGHDLHTVYLTSDITRNLEGYKVDDIERWINSESGDYYLSLVYNHLNIDKECVRLDVVVYE